MHGAEDVGEIVGPKAPPIGAKRLPDHPPGERCKVFLPSRHDDPFRGEPSDPPACIAIGAHPPHQARIVRQSAENRLQFEEAVGDVDRQQAVIGQSVQIDLHRLAGDQMDRHRIGAEHVEHQQVEFSRWPMHQREPCIAQDDFHLREGIGQVGEVLRVSGNALDGRIDLVERDSLAGLAVGGDCPRPQPERTDVVQRSPGLQRLEDLPQRSLAMVVGPRVVPLVPAEALAAVARRTVHESVGVPHRNVHHPQHPEETPLGAQ